MSSTSPVRVNLYRLIAVDQPPKLSELISDIHGKNLADRFKLVSQKGYRLEGVMRGDEVTTFSAEKDLLFFNVILLRDGHGPAKASVHKALNSLEYGGDQPSEDTAAIYDPLSGCLAIQYAHAGPKAEAIVKYFNEFCSPGFYKINPVVDEEFYDRYTQQNYVQKFEATIDTREVTRKDFDDNKAMSSVFGTAEDLNGTKLHIEISVDGRQKGARLADGIKSVIDKLRGIHGKNENAITKLESKGPVCGGKPEIVDLLGGKLAHDVEIAVSTVDYRMDIDDRWKGIYRVYKMWKGKGYTK